MRFFGSKSMWFPGMPLPARVLKTEEHPMICHLHTGHGCLFCAAVPDEDWDMYVDNATKSPDSGRDKWERERELGQARASEKTLKEYRRKLGYDEI